MMRLTFPLIIQSWGGEQSKERSYRSEILDSVIFKPRLTPSHRNEDKTRNSNFSGLPNYQREAIPLRGGGEWIHPRPNHQDQLISSTMRTELLSSPSSLSLFLLLFYLSICLSFSFSFSFSFSLFLPARWKQALAKAFEPPPSPLHSPTISSTGLLNRS